MSDKKDREEGWRVVVKRGERTAEGLMRWRLEVYPPGGGRLVSCFETRRRWEKADMVKELLGKMELLLGRVAPRGIVRELEEAGKR